MPFTFHLCTQPGQTLSAAKSGLPLAHMAWQVGPGASLLAYSVGLSMRGGTLVLGDKAFDGQDGSADRLYHDLLHELENRAFTHLLCDFERPGQSVLERLIAQLGPSLRKRGIALIVPDRYAHCAPEAQALVSTAITQGTLAAHLRESSQRCGGRGLVLDMPVLRLDMTLPAPGGQGKALTQEELDALLRTRGGQSFYSAELCARYFTYRTEDSHHFVLFDDASTLNAKAQTALRLGVTEGYVLYPEAEGYLAQLNG